MGTPDEFIAWLDQKLREHYWTDSQLAQAAGISQSVISRARSGTRPGIEACIAIANAVGSHPIEVIVRAGLVPPPADWTPDREEWNAIFETLGDDDRENLLDLARIMRTRRKREERGADAKPKREPAR